MNGSEFICDRDSAIVRRIFSPLQLLILVVVVGCQSTAEFNPFVDIDDYDTVVIDDFEGPGTVGYEFAERIGRSLLGTGLFNQILREEPEGDAIRVRGKITRHSRGNPAMRLRYGHNIGNARFSAIAIIEDFKTGDLIATIRLNESFDVANKRNVVTQNLDTLKERAAQRLVEELRVANAWK